MNPKSDLRPGRSVRWKWRDRVVTGTIKRVYRERVELELRGARYVRNASPARPAFLVTSAAGNDVLKSVTELRASRGRR